MQVAAPVALTLYTVPPKVYAPGAAVAQVRARTLRRRDWPALSGRSTQLTALPPAQLTIKGPLVDLGSV